MPFAVAALALAATLPTAEAAPDEISGSERIVIDEDRSWWYECDYSVPLHANGILQVARGERELYECEVG